MTPTKTSRLQPNNIFLLVLPLIPYNNQVSLMEIYGEKKKKVPSNKLSEKDMEPFSDEELRDLDRNIKERLNKSEKKD